MVLVTGKSSCNIQMGGSKSRSARRTARKPKSWRCLTSRSTRCGSWRRGRVFKSLGNIVRAGAGTRHPNGERVVADDRELIFLNHNGAIVRKETEWRVHGRATPVAGAKGNRAPRRSTPANGNHADDDLIETYLKHKNVTGYYEREARRCGHCTSNLPTTRR